MPQYQATVVVPARNCATSLPEQLDALLAQDTEYAYEILVVANGCTDNTIEVASAYARDHDNLRVLESQPGLCHARNLGVLEATTETVLFCDADDIVTSDWVQQMTRTMSDLGGGILGGFLLHGAVNSPEVCEVYDCAPDLRETFTEPELSPDTFSDGRGVCGANFAVTRSQYLRVGGMDSSYVGGTEETDFCLRSRRANIPVNFCPNSFIHYRLRDTPRALYRQQRGYGVNQILYLIRAYDEAETEQDRQLVGGRGYSLRWTTMQMLKSAAQMPLYPFMPLQKKRRLMHSLGGHVGSFKGLVKFSLLHKVPPRQLMTQD